MARNRVAKVLNLECALETGGEEAAERCHQRGKGREDEDVELHRHYVQGAWNGQAGRDKRQRIVLSNEDGVGLAFEASVDVCAKILSTLAGVPAMHGQTYIDGADEVLVLGQEVCQANAPENGEEPRAEETLPCFLGRDLDERRPPERDAAQVREDVVGYDHRDWQDEPDESLKDVVDDEVRLSDNQEQGHVGPRELGKLELVVALLEGKHEEDEAYCHQQCHGKCPARVTHR